MVKVSNNEWHPKDEAKTKTTALGSNIETTTEPIQQQTTATTGNAITAIPRKSIGQITATATVVAINSRAASEAITGVAATAAAPVAAAAATAEDVSKKTYLAAIENITTTESSGATTNNIDNLLNKPDNNIKNNRKYIIMDMQKTDIDVDIETCHEKHESETNEASRNVVEDGANSNNSDVSTVSNLDVDNIKYEQLRNDATNTCATPQAMDEEQQRIEIATKLPYKTALNNIIVNEMTATPIDGVTTLTQANLYGMNTGALQQIQQQQQQQQQLPRSTTLTAKNYNNANSLAVLTGIGVGVGAAAGSGSGSGLGNNVAVALVNTPKPQHCDTALSNNNNNNNNNELDFGGDAKIVLTCDESSHPFQTRNILLTPNIKCKVGRLIAKSKASECNAIFDCKVLSRNHAELWYSEDGKFWVKDTKSSNGTFINDNKLGDEPAELHFGDVVKFGVEVMENSCKQVHGCIIAIVKLYMPDGREAISIDANSQRTFFTGANRISYDEMQRLNALIQEAAQREKILHTKLSSIQNVLDTTRKNSALCWQSMISEDQLLHKINLLERKLQIVEKNIPENALKNEIMKLMDDKTSYQYTAKEALRKVYQEHADAMQMLSKMELAHVASENECSILREQMENSNQSLEEVNKRLALLETEYNEYKDENIRQQQEAKEAEEQRICEINQEWQKCKTECEELRSKMNELTKQLAVSEQKHKQEEQLVLANLDDVIANIGLDDNDNDGDNDHDDDDEDEAEEIIDNNFICDGMNKIQSANKFKSLQRRKKMYADNDLKQKVVRKGTVMKWLKNSDLNKGENPKDLINAIFNNSDNDDFGEQHDDNENVNDHYKLRPNSDKGAGTKYDALQSSNREAKQVYVKFMNIVDNVQKNLQLIEEKGQTKLMLNSQATDGESSSSELETTDTDVQFIKKPISASAPNKISIDYEFLRESVHMLRDAFVEIVQKQLEPDALSNLSNLNHSSQTAETQRQTVATDLNKAMPCTNYAEHNPLSTAFKKLETQNTLVSDSHSLIMHKNQILDEQAFDMLNEECESWKSKVNDLHSEVQTLRAQKEVLEQLISNKTAPIMSANEMEVVPVPVSVNETAECIEAGTNKETVDQEKVYSINSNDVELAAFTEEECKRFEEQIRSELTTMNNEKLEQEEELVLYKERLELSESCNLQLRNEISQLKLRQQSATSLIVRRALPLGAVALAAIVYFFSARL